MSSLKHHSAGRQYWRSLEQLSESPMAAAMIEREFADDDPQRAGAGLSRRKLLKLLGASMALAGLTLSGCRRWPKEKLAPYTSNPPERMPGVPEQYATVMELGGVGAGLLVTSFDGRPIKVEGNPSHPFSRTADPKIGAADAYAQAAVLELYDPDRSRNPVDRTGAEPKQTTWDDVTAMFRRHISEALKSSGGAGFAVLCEASSGPSVADMRRRLMKAYPKCAWYEYEPIVRDGEIAGTKLAFGESLRPVLHLDKADAVVLLDADLLGSHPAHVRYSADWAMKRRTADEGAMSRVLMAESAYSLTGAAADHRLPVRPSRMGAIAAALAAKLGVTGVEGGGDLPPDENRFVDLAAAELKRAGKAGVVAAGMHLPAEIHAAVHAINSVVGAVGQSITYVPELDNDRPSYTRAIRSLVDEMKAGQVKMLLILGGNPVYDAPVDVDFAAAIKSAPMSVHLSLYHNETSSACKWHLPRAHWLETWGDARAWDGTISVAQPLIQPIFDGRSIIEVLSLVLDEPLDGYQIVRRTFASMLPQDEFEKAFRRVLHEGLLAKSIGKPVTPKLREGQIAKIIIAPAVGIELRFLQDHGRYDGRFANNGWLQELPDSLTKLTWDNAAFVSKRDADALGVKTGDVVRISVDNRTIEIAAYVLPGQPAGVIGLPLGSGRTEAGHIGNGVGFNTYAIRTSTAMDTPSGATVRKTGRTCEFALTQDHHIIDEIGSAERARRVGGKGESGPIIREATLEQYRKDKEFAHRHEHSISLPLFESPSKYNEPHRWGMALDMNACIGCGGCVVACQAENNVPIVGKEQVQRSREMHWLRIDRYFKGAADDPSPEVAYQPMLCVHCENAPCEQVCPVGATMHDTEGLNAMVYNRCVGTRYCSNNCPYKVRRFNYLDFQSKDPRGGPKPWLGMPDTQQRDSIDKIKRMVFNPQVTVRMRGVMEKCTFCVQRIRAVTNDRRNRGEDIKDGDIVTACQQACPTQAIVFGDLNDPESKVSRLHRNNRAYEVLGELDTRPRARHLAKVRNPAAET